ncbi:MAG TPA: phage terminase large subunit [Kofleriaceae bacterium]
MKLADLRFWRHDGEPQIAARPKNCYAGPAAILPDEFDEIVIAGDLAGGKLTARGDFNALVVVGRGGSGRFVLEAWVKRAAFPDVQAKVRELRGRWPSAKIVIESAAAGASLVSSLQAEIAGLVGKTANGDKESRLDAVLMYFEAGNVHLHDGAPGVDALITSLTVFPNGAHDDDVDAISLALTELADQGTDIEARWRALTGDTDDKRANEARDEAVRAAAASSAWNERALALRTLPKLAAALEVAQLEHEHPDRCDALRRELATVRAVATGGFAHERSNWQLRAGELLGEEL